jgi:hypothetical protein
MEMDPFQRHPVDLVHLPEEGHGVSGRVDLGFDKAGDQGIVGVEHGIAP